MIWCESCSFTWTTIKIPLKFPAFTFNEPKGWSISASNTETNLAAFVMRWWCVGGITWILQYIRGGSEKVYSYSRGGSLKIYKTWKISKGPLLVKNDTSLKGEMAQGSPPPIIFETWTLLQQTIYHWKGNLTSNRIHFKYLKNILISRFYEQLSWNGSVMAPEQLFEKISNFKNMNVLYIILKHVVWTFRIYNYFREIFKFRDFMNT